VQSPGFQPGCHGRQSCAQPRGRLVYLEHDLSEEPRVNVSKVASRRFRNGWQEVVAWTWILEALARTGAFRVVQVTRFLLDRTPRIAGSRYRGLAVRSISWVLSKTAQDRLVADRDRLMIERQVATLWLGSMRSEARARATFFASLGGRCLISGGTLLRFPA
jgi:hypothetical protein